jgi:hypothetical protein
VGGIAPRPTQLQRDDAGFRVISHLSASDMFRSESSVLRRKYVAYRWTVNDSPFIVAHVLMRTVVLDFHGTQFIMPKASLFDLFEHRTAFDGNR